MQPELGFLLAAFIVGAFFGVGLTRYVTELKKTKAASVTVELSPDPLGQGIIATALDGLGDYLISDADHPDDRVRRSKSLKTGHSCSDKVFDAIKAQQFLDERKTLKDEAKELERRGNEPDE